MAQSRSDNLLEYSPPPSGKHRERILFFAKVLAYGVITDQWSPRFRIGRVEDAYTRQTSEESWSAVGHSNYEQRLRDYLNNTWHDQQPQAAFLESFGFLEQVNEDKYARIYMLTPNAYELLNEPLHSINVFISYCHSTSSAFALALEYRLEARGVQAFIDRSIPRGDDWHERLHTTVEQSQVFVCLITKEALESRYIQNEIQWAAKNRRIPIWQPGFIYDNEQKQKHPEWLRQFVESKQAIRLLEESAESYHDATEKFLNELGFVIV
jgi:hypothetical protein